jgi:penicillin-binding protein 1A
MALMAALRAGVDPDATHYVSKSPTKFDDPTYGPIDVSTYSESSAGNISLRKATLLSDNSVYIQLALDVGPDKVKQAAWDLGIRSKLNGYPAETLGGLTDGVSPLEMANAYATIASGGMRNRPTAITRVTFPDGHHELPARWKVRRTRAFEDGVAAKATEILKQNMTSGTGTTANISCPAAGKTGTTDEFTDAWFVGFTPRLSTAVWVGYPNDRTQMLGLYHGANVAGATFPSEIWHTYMEAAKGKFCGDFPPPKTPFSSQPFFGRYTSSGGKGNPSEGGVEEAPSTTTPVVPDDTATPEADAPEEDTGGAEKPGNGNGDGNGNGNGNGFDPEQYESPPQPPPGDENGGTQAPG